jgi:ankyrin repeat protein
VNRPSPKPSGKLTATDLVNVLLKHGADPNQTLRAPLLMRQHATGDTTLANGATPLMRAAKAGDLGLIKALLAHGADPSRALPNGNTALSIVMTGRGARTLTPETPMFQAVKLLLEHGADVNAAGANGATLLHQSLDRGLPFVQLLVEKGAKLDLKDGSGRTPLDIALGVAPLVSEAPAGGAGARGGAGGGARGRGGAGGPAGAPAAIDPATIAFLRERSSPR